MRLSQLARKLEISPSELLNFFKDAKVSKYSSHNNKIIDEHIELAIQHYKVEIARTELNIEIENTENEEQGNLKTDTILKSKDIDNSEEQIAPVADGNVSEQKEEIEVIRMPKIKLEGVKIVGKIELPESKKKSTRDEFPKSSETEESNEIIKPERKNRLDKRSRKGKLQSKSMPRGQNRELSYEEKLKRQEQKRIREQQNAKRIKKEQKKQNYLKNVQANNVQPLKKKKHEKIEEKKVENIKAKPQYKNPIRKLWAWLNGEYDKY